MDADLGVGAGEGVEEGGCEEGAGKGGLVGRMLGEDGDWRGRRGLGEGKG